MLDEIQKKSNNNYFLNKRDNIIFIILDKIAKYKGWGLLLEPGMNKPTSSELLYYLEKGGYIIISGKNITEEKIIEYHYLDFTIKGKDLYLRMKNKNYI